MKNLLFIITLFIYFTSSTFAQENFEWDKVLNIQGDQYELFLKAKRYISNNKGIQYSDEKNKTVVAFLKTKAKYEATSVVFNNLIFEYRIQILTKNNRIRVIIDKVVCVERKYNGMPASTTYLGEQYGLEMDKFFSVMKGLRDALNTVVSEIEIEMNKSLTLVDNEW